MKKIFYSVFASALLLAGGCAKEIANPENENNEVNQGDVAELQMKSVSLDASMQQGVVVKSLVNDEGEFCWTSDDAIAVYVSYTAADGNAANGFFKFDIKEISSENDNVATFEGEIPANGTMTGVAVYPYNDGHVYADGKLSVNFPSQISESNHLPAMYAKVDGETLEFKHISSMLRLTYKHVPAGTNGLTLTSDAIAGLYDVDLETGELTATDNATNQVKVSFTEVTIMQEEMSFYVPVPAGERTLAVNLNKGDELVEWSSISSKYARDFKTGHITLLPAKNVNFSELYIIGASEDLYNWQSSRMKPITRVSDHVFTWTGNIYAGNRFRFPVQKGAFHPAVCISDGKPFVFYEGNNNSLDFKPSEDGNYTLTVDATDMDNIKVDMRFNCKIYPDKYLFINGAATERMAYDKNAQDWMWMTQVERGVFEWTGHLSDNKGADFKFLTKSGSWLPSYNRDETADDNWTMRYRTEDDNRDYKFEITEDDGIYKVTADLNTMKVSCELLESCPRYFITGKSVGGFNQTPAIEYMFTYVSDGVYTWTGNLEVDTGNGFKIIEYGALNPSWGPVGGATKVGDVRVGTTEWSDVDRKWDLKSSQEFSKGKYTITLDTKNCTIEVTPM